MLILMPYYMILSAKYCWTSAKGEKCMASKDNQTSNISMLLSFIAETLVVSPNCITGTLLSIPHMFWGSHSPWVNGCWWFHIWFSILDNEIALQPQILLKYPTTVYTVRDTGTLFHNKKLRSSGSLVTPILNPKYKSASNGQASDPYLFQKEPPWSQIDLDSQIYTGPKMVSFWREIKSPVIYHMNIVART